MSEMNSIKEMLELQLSELEMLESIFVKEGELEFDSPDILSELREFVSGESRSDYLPKQIAFTVKLALEEVEEKGEEFELICSLPHEYPGELPDLYARSQPLSRTQQHKLNADLANYVSSLPRGESCIWQATQWLQEHFTDYLRADPPTDPSSPQQGSKDKPAVVEETFGRLWILSHHIYSKFKRKDIVDWAHELKLSGFSMPGKPGIVCVEGPGDLCEEFWQRLRALTWKRISCKHREFVEVQGQVAADIEHMRLFGKFEEKNFNAQSCGHRSGRDYHMNLGLLYSFLDEHQSAHVFKIMLGVEGQRPKSVE